MANVPVWVYVLLVVSIGCSSAAQIFQKLAAHDLATHNGSPLQLLLKRNILLSIFFLGTGLLLWLVVLGKLPADAGWGVRIIAFVALVFGTLNVIGGFAVTDRMLGMFKGKKEAAK